MIIGGKEEIMKLEMKIKGIRQIKNLDFLEVGLLKT